MWAARRTHDESRVDRDEVEAVHVGELARRLFLLNLAPAVRLVVLVREAAVRVERGRPVVLGKRLAVLRLLLARALLRLGAAERPVPAARGPKVCISTTVEVRRHGRLNSHRRPWGCTILRGVRVLGGLYQIEHIVAVSTVRFTLSERLTERSTLCVPRIAGSMSSFSMSPGARLNAAAVCNT